MSGVAVVREPQAARTPLRQPGLGAAVTAAAAANLSLLLTSVVRTKIVAVELGPSGSGVLAQLSTVVTLSTAVLSLGMANAGIREIAATSAAGDRPAFARVVATLLVLPVALACLILPLIVVGGRGLSGVLLGNTSTPHYLLIAAVAVPVTLGMNAITVVHQGLRRMQRLAVASLLSSLAGIAVTVPLTVFWGMAGAVWSLPLGAAGGVVVMVVSGRGLIGNLRPFRLIDAVTTKRFVSVGAASLAALTLTLGGDLVVRTVVVHRLGAAPNGLYQPVYLISTSGFAQAGNALGTVLLATLAGYVATKDSRSVQAVLDRSLRAAVVVMVPLVLAAMALRGPLLTLLASRSFTGADGVLALQVVGEIPRIAAYTAGAALLPQGRVAEWLAAGAAASLVRITACLLLLPSLGLMALAWSYVIEWVAVALLTYAVTRRRGPSPQLRTWAVAVVGTGVAGLLAYVVCHTAAVVGGIAALTVAVGWVAVLGRPILVEHRLRG